MKPQDSYSAAAGLLLACIAALLCTAGFGFSCGDAQESDRARKEFLEYKGKAETGDARAQFRLGFCYANGQGVEKDSAEAVKWFRKAADQNDAPAQSFLGFCYSNGEGV